MKNPKYIGFASDNYANAHKTVIDFITHFNAGFSNPYNDDEVTQILRTTLNDVFGKEVLFLPTLNGTGSNVLALRAMLSRWGSVIAPTTAHIQHSESGAPAQMAGIKILTVDTIDGKLRPQDLEQFRAFQGDIHNDQPQAISISNTTEIGSVYSPQEIKELAVIAHQMNLYVHLDGARIFNALDATKSDLKSMVTEAGVDIISFGCTKIGAINAESIIVLNPELNKNAILSQKQMGQLASKTRFISAQFLAMLAPLANGEQANESLQKLPQKPAQIQNSLAYVLSNAANKKAAKMHKLLSAALKDNSENFAGEYSGDNSVFPWFEQSIYEKLIADFGYAFHIVDKEEDKVKARLMFSSIVEEENIASFVEDLASIL